MTEFVPPGMQPSAGPQAGDAPGLPDPNAIPIWHYNQGGAMLGPITHDQMLSLIRGGGASPLTLVWREGMLQWANVKDVPELVPAINASTVMGLRRDSTIHRNARINCITMFVMFCLCMVTAWIPSCLGFGVFAGVFPAIYLPMRWRAIWSLPKTFGVLGVIGGFGLIALLLLAIAGLLMKAF